MVGGRKERNGCRHAKKEVREWGVGGVGKEKMMGQRGEGYKEIRSRWT